METAARSYAGIIFPDSPSQTVPALSIAQQAMLDATPDCIKVLTPDGCLLTMNRAGRRALKVPDDSAFGMRWLPLLAPDAQEPGKQALREAAEGKSSRFSGQSFSADGILYWDNLLTPIMGEAGTVLWILCVSRDVTETVLLKLELENAVEREKLLAREMQHRIKNLFTVVSSLVHFSEKEAQRATEHTSATSLLLEKIGALSRASDAAFAGRQDRQPTVETVETVDVHDVIASVLKPYGNRCVVAGGPGVVDYELSATLALLLHELACNSLKHGALSVDGGLVAIGHHVAPGSLGLNWTEAGGPPIEAPPEEQGYGSQMLDRVVRLAGGTLSRQWRSSGLEVELSLPAPRGR